MGEVEILGAGGGWLILNKVEAIAGCFLGALKCGA
jgi:hypothetical protein